MRNFEIQYSNDRTRYVNEANHFNGRSGEHQHTGTTYKGGSAVSYWNTCTDKYTYIKNK